MRVFHLLSNPSIGGIEAMLSELIPGIDETQWDMHVVNMRTESKAYQLWDAANVKYFTLRTPGRLLLTSIFGLARLLRRERPDVLEVYGLRSNIIGRLAGKLAGVPIIITGVLSTDDWRKWYHVWVDRATRWAVDSWIANSRACKQSLVDREKHPADRITVIYDGIDALRWTSTNKRYAREKLRSEWGFSENDIVFATIANLRPDKGVQYLVEAIPAVLDKQPTARFVLVGHDWMGGKLQCRCRQLGIETAVIFTGFRRDIDAIYEAADATVLPSLREGLPICLIEAMSMELPVIATAVSGTPELVINGQTGLLIPPRDVGALAGAIITMAADAPKRAEMGKLGRERVLREFSIERMASQLLAYYKGRLNVASK